VELWFGVLVATGTLALAAVWVEAFSPDLAPQPARAIAPVAIKAVKPLGISILGAKLGLFITLNKSLMIYAYILSLLLMFVNSGD
jgi:hypothetical protein